MWIRVDDDVITHPKTYHLARILGTDRVSAFGLIAATWGYARRYHPDGDLSKVELRSLHERLGFTSAGVASSVTHGHTSVTPAALGPVHDDVRRPLIEAGFCDRLTDGRIVLHDWDDHNGPEADKKRNARERKRLQREREEALKAQGHVTTGHKNVTPVTRDKKGQSHAQYDTVRSTPLPPKPIEDARASSDAIPRVRDLSKRLRETQAKP